MGRKIYEGLNNERNGGMSHTGTIIRDAWVFGIIPETQMCEGWDEGALTDLYTKTSKAWEPYGHLVSNLPDDLRERHARIYGEAIRNAREKGWDPELPEDDG